MFVGTNAAKNSVINANYHVTKGDRDKPPRRRQEQSDLIKPTTSYFNSAFDKTDCCPCEQCQNGKQQPDGGRGQRPSIA
jgi:hypothetical protein